MSASRGVSLHPNILGWSSVRGRWQAVEEADQVADGGVLFGGVSERETPCEGVSVPAADVLDGDVAPVGEVADDELDGAFGEADLMGDVAHGLLGAAGELHQHVPVVREESPSRGCSHKAP